MRGLLAGEQKLSVWLHVRMPVWGRKIRDIEREYGIELWWFGSSAGGALFRGDIRDPRIISPFNDPNAKFASLITRAGEHFCFVGSAGDLQRFLIEECAEWGDGFVDPPIVRAIEAAREKARAREGEAAHGRA